MPAMVNVYVPAAAEEVDVSVSVELPDVVIEVGAKAAVTPVGRPVADNATAPVKPFCAATLAVNVVALPAMTARELGDADSVKSAVTVVAFTVTLTVVL